MLSIKLARLPRRAALGALLAGGSSSRMGKPKSTIKLDGKHLAQWTSEQLSRVVPMSIQVGGQPGETPFLTVADQLSGIGPLSGIETALAAAGGRPIVVCAIDLPFVSPTLLRYALHRVRSGMIAAVPRWAGRWHPLSAAYAPDALGSLRAWRDAGRVDLWGWIDTLGEPSIEAGELSAFGDPSITLLNINTPADLERAAELLQAPQAYGPQAPNFPSRPA